MGPLDVNSKTPSRIPRPISMATTPKTPSIRTVPYNHTDRPTPDSWTPGSYSPSSWPFPKSAEPSDSDMSSAAVPQHDEHGEDAAVKGHVNHGKPAHQAKASTASSLTVTGSLRHSARGRGCGGHVRADPSIDSVQTQIYAPRDGDDSGSTVSRNLESDKGSFLGTHTGIPERPVTPTPYSSLRKTSETVHDGQEDETCKPDNKQHALAEAQTHVAVTPRAKTRSHGDSTEEDRCGINLTTTSNDPDAADTIITLRDEEGRVLSKVHPLFRTSSASIASQNAQDFIASSEFSAQAEYGSSDAGTATGQPQGIMILKSIEATTPTPGLGSPSKNGSLYSKRPVTLQDDMPDLESLRRGPKIRHSRLPPSPSTALNAGGKVPGSTRELWGSLGRLRKVMLISAIFLELAILNVVSGVTAVVVARIAQGYAGTGLVAWAAVSGALVLVFVLSLVVMFLRYRTMSKDLVSGENWIEMHHRSRPLPPRPQSEERKQDSGATEAWQKFVQDHEQLRRYVEFLESRIGILEEGRPTTADRLDNESRVDPVNTASNAAGNTLSTLVESNGEDSGEQTPKAKNLTSLGGSLSRRQLLQPENSAAELESWPGGSAGDGGLPKSDTKASILTELCDAVTEGYSPLSEPMPRGSPHVCQSPVSQSFSARLRGSTPRHMVLPGRAAVHQRQEQSVDNAGVAA